MQHNPSENRTIFYNNFRKLKNSFNGILNHLKVIIPIVILYLLLQLFWLTYSKDVVTPDETGYFAWAVDWAAGDYEIARLYGDRSGFIFLISIAFRIFGADLNTGRWVVHFFGIGLIVIIYFLGTELYDRRVGILSMLILTFSGFFQFLSYFGLTDIPSAFFFICTITFFLKAFKSKKLRYSTIGGLFFLLGTLTKISYLVVVPIIIIMWLKRTIKKQLSLKEAILIAASGLILPILTIVSILIIYPDLFSTAVSQGILPFAQEIMEPTFIRKRIQNLIWGSGEGILGTSIHPTSFSNLIRVLLFPGEYEGPWEQLYFQYYLIERWFWLILFFVSLIFRRTRKFDTIAWIITYGFFWLILTPAAGSIHVAEISDRYLYPAVSAFYIQFAALMILALDKIRDLERKSVLDYLLNITHDKRGAILFLLPMFPILWLVKPYLSNPSSIFICWAIVALIFLKVSKGKIQLTISIASITLLFIILANFAVQVRITDVFAPTTTYRDPGFVFPTDMRNHEDFNTIEEGIWFWASDSHVPGNRFMTKIFNEESEHFPGQTGGLYIWFSSYSLESQVTMYVRWTTEYSSKQEFKGYFEGYGIIFASVITVNFEDSEYIDKEVDNYLRFQGEVEGSDHDGFNAILDFLPNQKAYWIDWDLIGMSGRDSKHIFIGKAALSEFEGNNIILPPHRISFSSQALHLRWKGGSTLNNKPFLFNITYEGLVLVSDNWNNFPGQKDDDIQFYQYWGENKKFIPVQSYIIQSTFEEKLKEVDIFLSHATWNRKKVELTSLVSWNQTDPTYLHIGMGKRDLPLKVSLFPIDEIHYWSVSEGYRLFFKAFLTPRIMSAFGLLTIVWIIALVPLIWAKRSRMLFTKTKSSKQTRSYITLHSLTFTLTEKIEQNRLQLLYGWLFLGSLSISVLSMSTNIIPYWWGMGGNLYYEGVLLKDATWFLFWRLFEELILAGTIIMGISYISIYLLHLSIDHRRSSSFSKIKEKILNSKHETYNIQSNLSQPDQSNKEYRRQNNSRGIFYLSKTKKVQIKRKAASMAILSMVALTFVVVIQNDMQYMDQLTKYTIDNHDSLVSAYTFMEGLDNPESNSRVITYQPNFGRWYTRNKFIFYKLDSNWGTSHIWDSISRRKIEFVVITEWDDYSPFEKFDKYTERYSLIWFASKNIGWRTAVYATLYSDFFEK